MWITYNHYYIMAEENKVEVNLSHHYKTGICVTRPPYRQGRKYTAVKVFTINDESQHLLIYNVPDIGLDTELHNLCQRFGEVSSILKLIKVDNIEEFTTVYHVVYSTLKDSRFAKRNIDNRSFFGEVLHICYAPELETIEETKNKLITRRKEVSYHLKKLEFPKQFRNDGTRTGKKRKFENSSTHEMNNFQADYHRNTSCFNQISIPPSEIPLPGECSSLLEIKKLSEASVAKNEKPSVNIKPFEKLTAPKVSKIIFYNKDQSRDKADSVKD